MLGSHPSYDVYLTHCMFGSAFYKPTRLRVFGQLDLSKLGLFCTRRCGVLACGRAAHKPLGFGATPTYVAAEYPPKLCQRWAQLLSQQAAALTAVDRAVLQKDGVVKRHTDRGETAVGRKERRAAEDAASTAGTRNPRQLIDQWPEFAKAMAPVREMLLKYNELMGGALARQHLACGANPRGISLAELPPQKNEDGSTWTALGSLRFMLGREFGLTWAETEEHHQFSPWCYKLLEAFMKAAGDTDLAIIQWLREGAPLGIRSAISPGGHFPLLDDRPAAPETTLKKKRRRAAGNHPSFKQKTAAGDQPARAQLQELLEHGYGQLFTDRAAAESFVGEACYPAPLGDVVKAVPGGPDKHRLIQDLRSNGVNDVVSIAERQVLPRFLDHAQSLAEFSQRGPTSVLILDFSNAFMTIPASSGELAFNCCEVEEPMTLKRPLLDQEARQGTFIVWRVLGFGGRSYPLLYSRVASCVARATQAMLHESQLEPDSPWGAVSLQLYVDDPILTISGSREQAELSCGMAMTLWQVLGIPISWKKGQFFPGATEHTWIGVSFRLLRDGVARMTLPEKFLTDFLEVSLPFVRGTGHVSIAQAESYVGKAGRISHVLPHVRPFVTALYGALLGAKTAQLAKARDAPPGRAACRRFRAAALWMQALVTGGADSPLPLFRDVKAEADPEPCMQTRRIEIDASPWGGGGVLYEGDVATEYYACRWKPSDIVGLDVTIGESRSQTFWECVGLLLGLVLWARPSEPLAVLGDNTAALGEALEVKGRRQLYHVSRELAVRRAREHWLLQVAHLPSEANTAADACSRIFAPTGEAKQDPFTGTSVRRRKAPRLGKLWSLKD